jgi:PAS domain S-box-containing protein
MPANSLRPVASCLSPLTPPTAPRHCPRALHIVASGAPSKEPTPGTRRRAFEGSSSLLGAIVESSDDAIVSKDLTGTVMTWNAAAERIFGYTADEIVGRSIKTVIPKHLHTEEDGILSKIKAGERIDHYETTRCRKDGGLVDVSLSISPIKNEHGEIVGAAKIARDITNQKRNESRLARYRRRYQLLYDIGKKLSSDLDLGRIVDATVAAATEATGAKFGAFFYNVLNEKGESYLLYTLAGAPREAFAKFGMPRNTAIFDPTFKGSGVVRSDDIRQDPRYGKSPPHHGQPAGHLPVVSYLAVPVRSRTGDVLGGLFFGHDEPGVFDEDAEELVVEIAALAGLMVDNARLHDAMQKEIARRTAVEETKELLLHEVKHRVKNMLATLEVIVSQSLKDVPAEARKAFVTRIRALAGAHDLLTEHDWKLVEMKDVAERSLAPFSEPGSRRYEISGPSVKLQSNKSLMLALALHELGMNALKYGALSNAEGRVHLTWSVSDDEKALELRWEEKGGPPVAPPQRQGFGSTLVVRALKGGGGDAILKFEPTGVVCALHTPL